MKIEQVMSYLGYVSVFVAFLKGLQFIFSLTPTAKLRAEVDNYTKHLDSDNQKLKEHDDRIAYLEKKIETESQKNLQINERLLEAVNRLGSSMIAITNHMIDGNGIEDLREQRKELTDYFITKK